MNKYYSDKKSILILNVITFVILICIIYIIKYNMYYIVTKYEVTEAVIEIFIISLITIYGVWSLIILPMWRRSVCYTLNEDELCISSGVIIRRLIRVKLSDVQYVEAICLPVFVRISLNFLLINVSGKRVVLKLLSPCNLEEIYSSINLKLIDREER